MPDPTTEPRIRTERVLYQVRHDLSQEELVEHGERLATAQDKLRELEAEKSDWNKSQAAEIAKAKNDITDLTKVQLRRFVMQKKNCDKVLDYDAGTVTIKDPDSGEVVHTRPMTEDERQTQVFDPVPVSEDGEEKEEGWVDGEKAAEQLSDDAESVQTCRVCGCTDDDCSGCIERTGSSCSWVEEDLCSACVEEAKTEAPSESGT